MRARLVDDAAVDPSYRPHPNSSHGSVASCAAIAWLNGRPAGGVRRTQGRFDVTRCQLVECASPRLRAHDHPRSASVRRVVDAAVRIARPGAQIMCDDVDQSAFCALPSNDMLSGAR